MNGNYLSAMTFWPFASFLFPRRMAPVRQTARSTFTAFLIAASVAPGIQKAVADEFKITAFDATGMLTFQELPDAESYRVEWMTDATAPDWRSDAPGIPVIPQSGAGSQTVQVGVIHDACYYRVVASMRESPRAVTSSFNRFNEEWRTVDVPWYVHSPEPSTGDLPFDDQLGNPPGSVRAGDVYYAEGITAPAWYLGRKGAFYGGTFAFDIFIRYTDFVDYPALTLNSGTTTLYYDLTPPPVEQWHRITIPLTESGWRIGGTSAPVNEAGFKEVLNNLVGIYILTEWATGPDDTNVDNVAMTPP